QDRRPRSHSLIERPGIRSPHRPCGLRLQGTSVLGRFVPAGRGSAARDVNVAARAVLGVKIPVDRCPVVCARSQSLCNVGYTLLAAHPGPPPLRHALAGLAYLHYVWSIDEQRERPARYEAIGLPLKPVEGESQGTV